VWQSGVTNEQRTGLNRYSGTHLLASKPTITEAICVGTVVNSVGTIVTGFRHISNIRSSSYVIFALSAKFVLFLTPKRIVASIVVSRLDYANSILTGIKEETYCEAARTTSLQRNAQ